MKPSIFAVLLSASLPLTAQADEPWLTLTKDPVAIIAARAISDLDHETDLAAGDLNNDGFVDVVVARKEPFITFGRRTNVLLLNEGGVLVDRTERYASTSDLAGDRGFLTPTNDRDIAIGDLDGDGWLDVVTATDVSPGAPKGISHPRVYRNLGLDEKGIWQGIRHEDARIPQLLDAESGEPVSPTFVSVAIGDVDGDGDADLYFGDHDSWPWAFTAPELKDVDDRLLVNDGDGFFRDASRDLVAPALLASKFCNSVLLADFNQDKALDLLRQNGWGNPGTTAISYGSTASPGHFESVDDAYSGRPYFCSTGDLNGDGRLDLILSDNGADGYVLNRGNRDDGKCDWSELIPFQFVEGKDLGFASNSIAADLDGDGREDVIVTDVDPEVPGYDRFAHLFHNRGATEDGGDPVLVEERSGADAAWIGAAGLTLDDLHGTHDSLAIDLDNDGTLELILSRFNGTDVYRRATATTRAPTAQFVRVDGAFAEPNYWTEGIAFGDIDLDGDFDFFVARGEGWQQPGRKHQNGLFVNHLEETPLRFVDESVERLGYSESHAKSVSVADVTGDGYVDALFCNAFNTAPPFLFINRGVARPGYFQMESDVRGLNEALSSSAAAFGDLDNDGDLDLILADSGPVLIGPPGGSPKLYRNDGRGYFVDDTEHLSAPLKVGHMGVHLVDIDGDFDLDFFGPNRSGRDAHGHYLMLNDGDGIFHDASSLLPETTGSVYEADHADLDGDGDLDFLFTSLSRTEAEGTRFPLGEGPVRNLLKETGTLSFEKGEALGIDDDNDVALIDYDQDGDLDGFISSLGPTEKVLRNDGNLVFTLVDGVIDAVNDPSLDLGIADLDNDRAIDIITVEGLERVGADQPVCQLYRNVGPRDRRPPRILGIETLPEPSPPRGPWVVRASAQDDSSSNGELFLSGRADYVVHPTAPRTTVEITGPQGDAVPLVVQPGTLVTYVNRTTETIQIRGDGVDSGELAPDGEFAHLFYEPGRTQLRAGRRFPLATVAVEGELRTAKASAMGSGLWRFECGDVGVRGELVCFRITFEDRAGNHVRSAPQSVTLGDPPPRRGRRER